MGGETLFGYPNTQASPSQSASIGGGQALGQVFTINKPNRFIVGGGIWCQSGIFPANWLLWNQAVPGASLLSPAMSGLTPAPSGTQWRYFTFQELGLPPYGPLSTGITYIGSTWTPAGAGNYVFSNPGDFSYPFGNAPLSTAACVYFNGGPITQIPNTTGFGGRFYWDLVLETVPPRFTVVLGKAVQRKLQAIFGRAPYVAPVPPTPAPRPPAPLVARRPDSRRRGAPAIAARAPYVAPTPTGDPVQYSINGPGRRWTITMGYQNVSRHSTEKLPYDVSAWLAGLRLDPTSGTVSFAYFTNPSTQPTSGDWHAGSWDVSLTGQYVAMAPGPASVPLAPGSYYTWIKIVNSQVNELVIEQVGRVGVY